MQTTAGLPWALKVTAACRFDGSSVLSVPSVPQVNVDIEFTVTPRAEI
jgi:hypothetical protein